MKVAVVLPVHNAKAYLGACLESLLRQTLADLAVVAVDDGSTDGSGAVLEDYAARDARITVIHQKNAGVCAARNAALDLMENRLRPELIGFCDGDDWVEPGMLESMADAMESHQADAAVCGFRRVYPGRADVPAGGGARLKSSAGRTLSGGFSGPAAGAARWCRAGCSG